MPTAFNYQFSLAGFDNAYGIVNFGELTTGGVWLRD
jgi:hypothetical protein